MTRLVQDIANEFGFLSERSEMKIKDAKAHFEAAQAEVDKIDAEIYAPFSRDKDYDALRRSRACAKGVLSVRENELAYANGWQMAIEFVRWLIDVQVENNIKHYAEGSA